jgi:L-ascorbate metabolism protein UlaG (beta-lactamase superfamily)
LHIRWYGQSAFLLSGEQTVVIDPFGPMEMAAAHGIVFDYPPIEALDADLLLITHEHADHNAAEVVSSSTVIRSTAGTHDSPVGEVIAIASEHDDAAGTARGPNTIFRFALDGIRFCHLGDFGQPALRPEQAKAIGEIDVLFIPVGDGPTVGGESAAQVVRTLKPRLVVPMHYRTPAISFLDPPDAFLEALGAPVEQQSESEFDPGALLGGSAHTPTVVLLAPPLQSTPE